MATLATVVGDTLSTAVTPVAAVSVETVKETVSEVSSINGLDTVWVLLAAILVFWMQPGFAFVEAGFTRAKNTANILMKNFVDFMIGSFLYWFIGFGIMFGTGTYFGMPNFFSIDFFEATNIPKEASLIFQTVFCATAATIVSGAMAERTKFSMYIVFSVLITSLIYPISGHWVWGGGWLSDLGFHDFAGSTVVHACGGVMAFVGTWILGPRMGKYDKHGKARAIPGHNLSFAALGVFILWMGWFGFNPGSQLAASGSANAIAISHVFMTTNLAAALGGLAAMATSWLQFGKPSLPFTLNGILAGLVGITAGCDQVSLGGAAIIGVVCGVIMIYSVEFIDNILKIDDPVGASSVHGVCGFLGTVMVGLFSTTDGLFYGGGTHLLGVQTLGSLAVIAWAGITSAIIFFAIKKIHGLRVEPRIEEEGLDIYEH
ncbi:MAG: ammonium transporter, partial [Bacteroidaceae bacterium]